MPQPNHTLSNITDIPQDISRNSDTSISDPLSTHFSSPIPSQIANNPFNPPQGPISNIERSLSQAHLNHSFILINSSQSFQISLPLSFQSTPPVITLCSNLPTPDPYQHYHLCIGKHPETPLTLHWKHPLHNWAKQKISKSYKITPVQKHRAHDLLKQSKITFSVENVVEQDNLISHSQAAAPPVFRVKTNPSPFICQKIHDKFVRYTKNTAGYFVLHNPHSELSYTCPLQI